MGSITGNFFVDLVIGVVVIVVVGYLLTQAFISVGVPEIRDKHGKLVVSIMINPALYNK